MLNLQKFLEDCPQKFLDTHKSRSTETNASYSSLLLLITFHSLEEKLVSQQMAIWRKSKLGELAISKPIKPSDVELEENTRSRSAKLYSFLFY